ncbi:phytanoyl-CoA dioxygenase family protein [Kitasatospora sp. NBC_01300]|uniref:phytanoyl-CoA dioxygenase family protein n=1 Tax=Kitasatospora sp. NBC_01300 TaxID=2903574 RepID=UPI002F91602A|nr:phytanoyl-CoA dioxygenase family protein [Kitasatospora sp. NBC_01300]
MDEEQKYLFDLRGYLVLEDILSAQELASVNAALDGHGLWDGENKLDYPLLKRYNPFIANAGPLHTTPRPVRDLISNQKVLPHLEEVLGPDLRYDEGQVLYARKGAGALILHNGNTPWEYPPLTYQVRDGRIYGGHLIVAFCLTDALADQGGFAVVPGSHKSAFEIPEDFQTWQKVGDWVSRVPVRAGSVVLFADTATHGSWPWAADFERRVVFCRYTAGMVQHTAPAPVPEDLPGEEWTPVERRLLRPPFAWHFHDRGRGYTEQQRTSVRTAEGWTMNDHSQQIITLAEDAEKSAEGRG